MSECIDHVAIARERLHTAAPWLSSAGRSDLGQVANILAAQADATLALVEQQRIANLIALGQFRVGPDELPPFRHLVMRPVNAYDVEPTTDIATALGIGDDDE